MKIPRYTPILLMALVLPPAPARAHVDVGPSAQAIFVSAPLAVKMGCQSTGPNGPTITARLTNVGSKRFDTLAAEAIAIVDLTVLDESGERVVQDSGRDGIMISPASRILEPGQSLELTKYAGPDVPPNAFLPIADWGYRNLGSGTYTVIAIATKLAVPAWSSRCVIMVK